MAIGEGYQGATAPGPLTQAPDRRIAELDAALRLLEAGSGATLGTQFASDPLRAHQGTANRLDREPLLVGVTIHALAGMGWYKVQAGGGVGFIACCQVSAGGLIPLGVRDLGAIPPNSRVLVYKPRGLGYGMILGVLPPALRDGRIVNPDWLVPGGQSGLKREPVHTYPLQYQYANGGVVDWSGQRPVDGTALERGLISSTGIALLLDDYQAFLRVNEQCGLFLNYFDSHTRLAGFQLDIASLVHEEQARDDEGEARYFRGIATYPHEALGLYAPGTPFTATRDDQAVQYTAAYAKVDLPDDQEDVEPFYRWQEYGGYLGQGHLRLLAAPPRTAGVRRHGDADAEPDIGLWSEAVALDGGYTVCSAKSVLIARRTRICVPRARVAPEDPTGDDAAAANYRFSGRHGGPATPAHQVGALAVPGDYPSLRKVAAIDDLIALATNWKTLHPFHYHRGDYSTPQDLPRSTPSPTTLDRNQEELDFAALADHAAMADPIPKRLAIDHRYSAVDYFERSSFFHLADDGSVVLGCGFGAQLVFTGGHVRIEAPGDIQLCPGRDLIALADQVVLRARQSVDLSAAEHDVRIKAERNVQVLAGNAGTGGILLESRATALTQEFAEVVGEAVVSNGILLRAPRSVIAAAGHTVYLRTSEPPEPEPAPDAAEGAGEGETAAAPAPPGAIVIDAGKGEHKLQIYADAINAFCGTGPVRFHYGPTGDTSEVTKTYSFGATSCTIAADLNLGGRLTAFPSGDAAAGLVVDGSIACTGSVAAGGAVASRSGGLLGKVDAAFGNTLAEAAGQNVEAVRQLDAAGAAAHAAEIVAKFYQEGQVGNDDLLALIQFSYRDDIVADDADNQYHTTDLVWVERRWEQLARLGGGTGGAPWVEPPVRVAGQDLYPWPGRVKWRDDDAAFLALETTTMFDPTTGCSRDRPGPYETPTLADWKPMTMSDAYRLVRPGATPPQDEN